MARIRNTLIGVVHVDGHVLKAGDTIPEGVSIGGHLTDTGEPVGPQSTVSAPTLAGDHHEYPTGEPRTTGPDPLTGEELAEAESVGIPTEDVHPERVRGAIIGYQQGYSDAVGQFVGEQVDARIAAENEALFDPFEHDAVEVHEHLKANPEDTKRVVELERQGKQRKGIIEKYAV